jgi:hypothetical protein
MERHRDIERGTIDATLSSRDDREPPFGCSNRGDLLTDKSLGCFG